MSPKVKKILALMLALGVAAVWIPQLLSANAKVATRSLLERPAEGPSSTTESQSKVESSGAQTSTDGAFDSNGTASENSLDSALARSKVLAPEKTGLDLDALAAAWNVPSGVGSAAPVETKVVFQAEAAPRPETSVDLTPRADPIQAFLASHPLQGTLIGTQDRVANLGPMVVRVGDEPVQGLVVTAIEARYVTFDRAGTSVRAELIPFQARPASRSSASSSASSGGAATQTAPATPIDPTLSTLLPLLQNAAQAMADVNKASAPASDANPPSGTTKTPANSTKEPHGP